MSGATSWRCSCAPVDLGDADSVVEATAGADALFWVDPPTFAANPITEYARFGANAAHAVTTNGIARAVFQSSIGAEKRGTAPGR